ncbi:MAG TPA: M15 family metallopeptidase, partial [Polyangia bacterium]|nr:M15 family metallopeptidase [Polyangia bacterium]
MRGGLALLVLALGGCSGEEPAWQEGPIGEIYEGLSVGGAGGCSTFVVDGLSKQLIAEQNCIRANALVSFAGKPGIAIGSNVYPYLEPKAAAGLEAAGPSSTLQVTSAFRTVAQQYLLYHWYQTGQCGISLAAVPGNSNHETGIAVDLGNYGAEVGNMSNHGWTHSYPTSDPVHFDYTAGGTVDLRTENVLAFQKLWNLNNAGDKIAEDGSYGPATASKIAAAPATGFAKGTTCTPQTTPPPTPSNPQFAAALVAQSMPSALGAG